MPNHPRKSKPPNQWNRKDLDGFHIDFEDQTREEFFSAFGVTEFLDPDQPGLAGFWNGLGAGADDETALLQGELELAMVPGQNGAESDVDTFVYDVLDKVGFRTNGWYIQQQYRAKLGMCRKYVETAANLAVRRLNGHAILLVECKRLAESGGRLKDPTSQLIAGIIAAYQNYHVNSWLRSAIFPHSGALWPGQPGPKHKTIWLTPAQSIRLLAKNEYYIIVLSFQIQCS